MSGPETRIQRNIQALVRRRGGYVIKIHGSPLMPVGTPDLLCCYRGYFIGMEVKTPDTQGDVSPAQRLRITEIRAAGGSAIVVWDVDQVERYLNKLDALIDALDVALDSVPAEAAEKALKHWHKRIRR